MAEKEDVCCEGCELKGEMKPSMTWCNDCEGGFCEVCVKIHEATKALRKHHLIPVADRITPMQFSLKQICEDHKKKIDYFCIQHDQMLCLKCVQLVHNYCDVSEFEEAAKGIKSSTRLLDLEDSINSLLENVKTGHDGTLDIDKTLNKEQERIHIKINDLRQRVNEHFNSLQEKLKTDLKGKVDTQKIKLEHFRIELSLTDDKLKTIKQQISNLKMFASDTQTFIGLRDITKKVLVMEALMKETMMNLPEYTYDLKANLKVESLFQNVKKFGDIIVDKKVATISYIEPKEKQAQFSIEKHSPKNQNTHLRLRIHFQVKPSQNEMILTNCAILPNKRLVFADSGNKKLLIHNEKGKFERYVKLDNQPFDITVLGKDCIAVTYTSKSIKTIDLFDITSYKKSELSPDCRGELSLWGICSDNERSLYAVAYPDGLKKITPTTNKTDTISVNVHNVYNVTFHDNTLYYTNKGNNTIVCCDVSGNKLWTFKDKRLRCSGSSCIPLTSDNSGCIYAVGSVDNIIMMISSDGRESKIVLEKCKELNNPRGIFFEKKTKQLLICNQDDGYASFYDVDVIE